VAGALTLLRTGLAFLAVAALFVGYGWVAGLRKRRDAIALAAEALALTLLGTLWFASLGHGGWVLVFLLLGLLVSAARTAAGPGAAPSAQTAWLRATALSAVRYVAAGALLFLIAG
jgi:hypothetical protein